MGGPVNMVDQNGDSYSVPEEKIADRQAMGWHFETPDAAKARINQGIAEEKYGGVGGSIDAYGASVWRGASGGLSDVAIGALGGRETLEGLKEAHPYLSGAGNVVGGVTGAVTGVGPMGWAAKGGTAIAEAAGSGALARIGGAALGGALEGGVQGLGEGISELALSEDPVTWERATSILPSRVLFGAAVGGATGGLVKAGEVGLSKAKVLLDEVAAARAAGKTIPGEIEQHGKDLADELASFRREVKEQKHFLTTKDVGLDAAGGKIGTSELGGMARKANRALDNLLDDPKGLAQKPELALKALRQHENVLEKTLERADDLKVAYAADTSGTRLAALEKLPAALERNRAIQSRIGEVTAAREAAKAGTGEAGKSMAERMVGGSVFGTVTGAVAALPIPGSSWVAPFLGAKASKFVTDKVFGTLSKASAEQAARASKAVGAFMDATAKVAPAAPVLASKVLASAAFGPKREPDRQVKKPARAPDSLAKHYKARSEEIRAQTTFGPAGVPVMHQEARMALGAQLAPIHAVAPLLADRMETIAARRLEFLAGKLPRRPELGGMQFGPDAWQPSDMEMRAFARYVAAVEDPYGVVERLGSGAITPEDAEAMRAVYPELMQDITMQIVSQLPKLRQSLPYQRRLALSIFSGVPVDPACDPMILSTLQEHFTSEPGTEGGTKPPMPAPQFGSVKAEKPTPSQERAGT